MSPEKLLRYFERISETSEAISRLRRFVLDLSVRGKLVEQRVDEQPDIELQQKIRNSRDAHRGEAGADCEGVDLLWPSNWISAQLGDVIALQYGKPLTAGNRTGRGNVPVYGSNGVVGRHDTPLIRESAIIVGRKGSAGALNLCDGPSWTTDVAYYVIPPKYLNIRYLLLLLRALRLESLAKGVKPGLNREDVYQLGVAVPPLAEQCRIVAKANDLMALCDELEATQAKRERRRDRLVAATLHGLNNGGISAESGEGMSFKETARFYFNYLPSLTPRHEHVQQLRLTILNLASKGRLVEQNCTDDSPQVLLSEAGKVREHAGARSKQSCVDDSDQRLVQHLPKKFPCNWVACPLEELFRFIDYRGRTPIRTKQGVRLITAKNIRMGSISDDPIEFIGEEAYKRWMTRGYPRKGDLLFVTEGATMGYVAPIELQFPFALAQRTIDLQPYVPVLSQFFLFVLMSPMFQDAVVTNSTGTAVRGIKAAKLRRIRVPLPPLGEQQRIVTKVVELMDLCDKLQAALNFNQKTRRALLEATLQQALGSDTAATAAS